MCAKGGGAFLQRLVSLLAQRSVLEQWDLQQLHRGGTQGIFHDYPFPSVMFAAQALSVPICAVQHCAVCPSQVACCSREMSVCFSTSAVLKTKDALDLLVMTGMGFDAQGHRLGRGGG